ncbi:hypothetical protein N7G274_002121 [Stereocaulon virgatum]|uniref:Uncharacterized protein n=1 Tax=Stereocaulon virgatum TaxID=373712 RepID=A0ABR4ALJ8_9LECA
MRPTLEPINTVIQGREGLDYVNQRLMRSGVFYTRVGAVKSGHGSPVSPSTATASPMSCDAVDTSMSMASSVWGYDILGDLKPISTASDPFLGFKGPRPKPLNLISPDSKICCDSPDCPIKGIPHNIGRYFDDGVRPLIDEADDVIRFFNCTVPPSDICGAYMRIFYGQASQVNKDKVRQYQKHHMWSPINSEPSTPRLHDPDATLPASYAHLVATESNIITSHGVIGSSKLSEAPLIPERDPLRIQVCLPSANEPLGQTNRNRCGDSEDLLCDASKDTEINPRYPMAGNYADDNDDEAPVSPGARRDIPEGPELRRVHLQLQAKIVGQIGQLVHGPDSPPTDWDGLIAEWRNDTA